MYADYPSLPGYLFIPIFYQTNTHTFIYIYIYNTQSNIFIYVYQDWLKLLQAFQSYAGTYLPTNTPFLYTLNSRLSGIGLTGAFF
jgi:hypothetical protein